MRPIADLQYCTRSVVDKTAVTRPKTISLESRLFGDIEQSIGAAQVRARQVGPQHKSALVLQAWWRRRMVGISRHDDSHAEADSVSMGIDATILKRECD